MFVSRPPVPRPRPRLRPPHLDPTAPSAPDVPVDDDTPPCSESGRLTDACSLETVEYQALYPTRGSTGTQLGIAVSEEEQDRDPSTRGVDAAGAQEPRDEASGSSVHRESAPPNIPHNPSGFIAMATRQPDRHTAPSNLQPPSGNITMATGQLGATGTVYTKAVAPPPDDQPFGCVSVRQYPVWHLPVNTGNGTAIPEVATTRVVPTNREAFSIRAPPGIGDVFDFREIEMDGEEEEEDEEETRGKDTDEDKRLPQIVVLADSVLKELSHNTFHKGNASVHVKKDLDFSNAAKTAKTLLHRKAVDAVFLHCGFKQCKEDLPKKFRKQVEETINKLDKLFPKATCVLHISAVLPCRGDKMGININNMNKILKDICDETSAKFVNFIDTTLKEGRTDDDMYNGTVSLSVKAVNKVAKKMMILAKKAVRQAPGSRNLVIEERDVEEEDEEEEKGKHLNSSHFESISHVEQA